MSVSIETKALAEKAERLAGQKTLLDWIGSFGSEDIGVDIGTSNVVIYVKHKGVVFPEASVIARHAVTKEFFAYGTKAEEMEGKAPRDIEIVHPMKRSAIIDYNGAAYLLNSIVNQSYACLGEWAAYSEGRFWKRLWLWAHGRQSSSISLSRR